MTVANDEPTRVPSVGTPATSKMPRVGWRLKGLRDRALQAIAFASPNRRLIKRSGLFDARWYLRQYPAVAQSGLSPLAHYLTIGWKQGFSPGPDFDSGWYLDWYRDVAAADCEPLLHYLRHGINEGRAPKLANDLLIERFLSLGDNCEFGLVQRQLGGRTIGLFNFAIVSIDNLIAALDSQFRGVSLSQQVTVGLVGSTPNREYYVTIGESNIGYHTGIHENQIPLAKLREQELRRVVFLARKFMEDLEGGDKILVFKSNVAAPRAKIDELTIALNRFGPNTLLWVTQEASDLPVGTVEQLANGLLRGHIGRFAAYDNAGNFSVSMWQQICGDAHRMWVAGRYRKNVSP